MRKFRILFSLLTLLSVNFAANGTLVYDANASSSFTLISAGGMAITAESGLEGPFSMSSGSGTASIDADLQSDPTTFPLDPVLLQDSDVSGSVGSPFGTSSAASLNSFFVTLDNAGTSAATAVFEFAYSWDVSLIQGPASEADLEAGFASAFFHLSGFAPSGGETLAIDEGLGAGIIGVADWLFNPFIAFEFDDLIAPASMVGSTTVTAYVTVPALSTDRFSVITDASGAAIRVIEPDNLALILMAFAIAHFTRRSRYSKR
jgi:hypothetical protein